MKRVGNNQWQLMFGASLDGERTSEKWPLQLLDMKIPRSSLKLTTCGKNSQSGFRSAKIPRDDNAFRNKDSFGKSYQANEVGGSNTAVCARRKLDAGP